jgi:hypothetical protein
MDDATLSPNMQKQQALQRQHDEWLRRLATQARVREQEAKQKAKANEAKAKGEG